MPLWTFLEILSWASGTIFLLSMFSLLKIVLIHLIVLHIFLQSLNYTGLSLVSVCLSSQSLFFSWLYPWKVSSTTLALVLSICTDSQIEIKHFDVLSTRFIFFLISNAHFHVDIICLFHGGYHAHLNILFIVFNGFLPLIIY